MANSSKMPTVAAVSVLGCSLARDGGITAPPNAAGAARVSNSVNSFAGTLHKALKNRGNSSDVLARVYDVGVLDTGAKVTFADDADDNSTTSKLPHSKVRFYWNGATQMREWSY